MSYDFTIDRFKYDVLTTLGKLRFKVLNCFTLEDAIRPKGIKVPGFTAIPAGKYMVKLYDSPTFGLVPMIFNRGPHIIEVGGIIWKYVLMHGGNRHPDSEACIMTGNYYAEEKSELIVNGESIEYNDYIIYDNCIDDIISFMQKGEIYSLLIKNN